MSTRYVRSVADAADFLVQAPLVDKDNAPMAFVRDIDQLMMADPESSSASAPTLIRVPGATISVQTTRQRFTTAEWNAGVTILAAIAGWKYKIVDISLIAIGGNAATATSVRVSGTQSASVVRLMTALIAALTQSTVVKPNSANVTMLADGAWATECDANTAITGDVNNNNLATATHVDVIVSYVLVQA